MSGEMHAVAVTTSLEEKRTSVKELPITVSGNTPKDVTEKERAVAKESGASTFDRLIEVNLELTKAVSRLVKTTYVTQAMQLALFIALFYMFARK